MPDSALDPERTKVSDYRHVDTSWDEMVDEEGQIRPAWKAISHWLKRSGREDFQRIQRETSRRLKEQGVYYHVYDDPEGMRRTWKLDPLPLLVDEREWLRIESGISQRARLLSCLLQDIYGSQNCLRDGVLPPEVIVQHPGYLTALRDAVSQPLTLYAGDVARGPDGNWWVIGDRAQGPSGAGYVLEARLVTRQVLGSKVSELSPAPLSNFFKHLKRHLSTLAPLRNQEATIVLLSSGIGNEVYFEHAYLAAQLGITLVEGSDLTVRRGRVFLKTVDDLKQVDVIIRRIDDAWSDPLALRPDSMLGVPGLLQAQASGRVAMANPIGSAVLESPALMPFMQGLSRYFLGEDLKLQNAASWWCGQPDELKHVIANLDDMVVKSINRNEVIFGGSLNRKQREALIARIRSRPWYFIGQERLSFSTLPTLVDESLQPRHLVLRGFAVGDGKHYDVMPGGLARVSPDANTFIVSSQSGGSSKDTWVLRSSGKSRDVLSLRPPQPDRVSSAILTSSAAENLYWMARYNERSEALLRLIRAYARRLENPYDYGFDGELEVLKALRPMLGTFCPIDGERLIRQEGLQALLLNSQRVGSVSWNLNCSIRSAYRLRDLWSGDCWRLIEELEELLLYSEKNWALSSIGRFSQPFLIALLGFWGAAKESISIAQGGLWLQLGRRIERALNTLILVRLAVSEIGHDREGAIREMLLESQDCLNAHRRQFGTEYAYQNVWQHLLLAADNPRSLQYALDEIEPALARLQGRPGEMNPLQKALLRVQTEIRLADPRNWRSPEQDVSEFTAFLSQQQSRLHQLGNILENTYFQHAGTISRIR